MTRPEWCISSISVLGVGASRIDALLIFIYRLAVWRCAGAPVTSVAAVNRRAPFSINAPLPNASVVCANDISECGVWGASQSFNRLAVGGC